MAAMPGLKINEPPPPPSPPQRGKLDADPHFWMPLTLERAPYVELMGQKRVARADAEAHFDRVAGMVSSFVADAGEAGAGGRPLFGAVDVGRECYWWDYGQLHLYARNNLLATGTCAEAACLRLFLRVPEGERAAGSELGAGVSLDARSCVLASRVLRGALEQSLVSCSWVGDAEVSQALMVNVTARRVRGKHFLLYNVVDDSEEGLQLEEGEVRADIHLPDGTKLSMRSTVETHGGDAWEAIVCGNAQSFRSVYDMNQDVDLHEARGAAEADHARVVALASAPAE